MKGCVSLSSPEADPDLVETHCLAWLLCLLPRTHGREAEQDRKGEREFGSRALAWGK